MGLHKEAPLVQKVRQSFWFKALWEGDLYLISSTTVVSIAVYSQEPNLEVLNSVWSGQRKLFPEWLSQDMTCFWFLIFLLKINEIILSELFDIEHCKKGKGWKLRRKLFIHQPIISVIKVHILASPTFWHGQEMSRNTVATNSNVSYPWCYLVQVLWSQQWNGIQRGAILICKGAKKIPSDNCACQHLWILLIEGPLWEHCLPLQQVPGVGLLSLPCLRIGCLAAGGCLDFHHNPWSHPCSQEPAHPIQPAAVWWITLWLCLLLSADDRESPGGWHLCLKKLKLDEMDPTHVAHTPLIAVSKDLVCISKYAYLK